MSSTDGVIYQLFFFLSYFARAPSHIPQLGTWGTKDFGYGEVSYGFGYILAINTIIPFSIQNVTVHSLFAIKEEFKNGVECMK